MKDQKDHPGSEFQEFDAVMRKILSASHRQLRAREHKYKAQRARKRRAKC